MRTYLNKVSTTFLPEVPPKDLVLGIPPILHAKVTDLGRLKHMINNRLGEIRKPGRQEGNAPLIYDDVWKSGSLLFAQRQHMETGRNESGVLG